MFQSIGINENSFLFFIYVPTQSLMDIFAGVRKLNRDFYGLLVETVTSKIGFLTCVAFFEVVRDLELRFPSGFGFRDSSLLFLFWLVTAEPYDNFERFGVPKTTFGRIITKFLKNVCFVSCFNINDHK